SASAEPFAHSRPKLAGCSGSPRTVTAPEASLSAMTPQPTPQYGQLVFTGTGDHPHSAGTAAAVWRQSQTMLFSTLVGCARVHPSSGATAVPLLSSMTKLCSGQVTRLLWTMPCDNGPPLCGQRSSSANTSSSAVRNTAMSPDAVRTTRE